MLKSVLGKVVEGVTKLLPGEKHCAVTDLLLALMECRQTPQTAAYSYFDPRIGTTPVVDKQRTVVFKDGIVFVVGGGTYTECANLALHSEKANKRVIYGATEMVSGGELLAQILELVN